MLITFVTAAHERARALNLARWIEEIGAGKGHDVVLCLTQLAANHGLRGELEPILKHAFDSCTVFIPHDSVEVPWGEPMWDSSSPNHLFSRINRHIDENLHRPYLYLEMDAVPTRSTAFKELEADYAQFKKPFMGDCVNNGRHPMHMSGVAVYPPNIIAHSVKLASIAWNCRPTADRRKAKLAWDIAACSQVVPQAHFTRLIQHVYQLTAPCRARELWNGQAAVFHQCKCGCLIERLRADKPATVAPTPVTAADPVPENTIFTYFARVPNIDEREQWLLIDLWKYSWRKAGWNPVVLSPGFIPTEHDALCAKLDALPSVNPVGYDSACFRRWLAVSTYGGWMCDYDVMNNGFEPRPAMERLTVYQAGKAVPSLVSGTSSEFFRITTLFVERGMFDVQQVNGKPHVSDMTILQSMPEEFNEVNLVKNYGLEGWQTAKAIHFANQTMNGKKPRSEWIPRLLWGVQQANGHVEPSSSFITGAMPSFPPARRKRAKPAKKKRHLSEEHRQVLRDRLAVARERKKQLATA